MTEAEWLACEDLRPMMGLHRVRSNARKLRLFVRACCGRVEHLMDKESLSVVQVAERFADGLADAAELMWARAAARRTEKAYRKRYWAFPVPQRFAVSAARLLTNESIAEVAAQAIQDCHSALALARGEHTPWWQAAGATDLGEFVPLLREVFGNPFGRAAFASWWRTPDVLSLAPAAYERRGPAPATLDPFCLNLLADALEDAGCDNADILDHLRSPGPHVRGCWALDLVLGEQQAPPPITGGEGA